MTGQTHPAGAAKAGGHQAAEGPARIRPALSPLAWLSSWLERPSAWGALAAVSAVLCAGIYFGLIRPARPARPRADFPVRPRIDAAISQAQVRLASNPQDIASLVELGMLHFEKGAESYPDAVNELEEARRLGALDTRIFYCLGVMYQELGLYPFALEEYQRHLRNFPEDREVRLLVAKILYQQGDYAAAVKEYERLRFHDPNDPLIIENLGLSLWRAKLLDRASEVLSALKASGGLPGRRAQFYLGQIAFENGRVQEALELMRSSLPDDTEPDFGIPKERMYAAVAMALQKLNSADAAREAWQRVLKFAPSDAKAQAALRDLNRRFPPKRPKKR